MDVVRLAQDIESLEPEEISQLNVQLNDYQVKTNTGFYQKE